MDDKEIRLNTVVSVLISQRNQALNQVADSQAEIAVLREQLKIATQKLSEQANPTELKT